MYISTENKALYDPFSRSLFPYISVLIVYIFIDRMDVGHFLPYISKFLSSIIMFFFFLYEF